MTETTPRVEAGDTLVAYRHPMFDTSDGMEDLFLSELTPPVLRTAVHPLPDLQGGYLGLGRVTFAHLEFDYDSVENPWDLKEHVFADWWRRRQEQPETRDWYPVMASTKELLAGDASIHKDLGSVLITRMPDVGYNPWDCPTLHAMLGALVDPAGAPAGAWTDTGRYVYGALGCDTSSVGATKMMVAACLEATPQEVADLLYLRPGMLSAVHKLLNSPQTSQIMFNGEEVPPWRSLMCELAESYVTPEELTRAVYAVLED